MMPGSLPDRWSRSLFRLARESAARVAGPLARIAGQTAADGFKGLDSPVGITRASSVFVLPAGSSNQRASPFASRRICGGSSMSAISSSRVRRPGHQHSADSDGLHHSICGCRVDAQGRERRAGRVFHRGCRHTHGDPVDSSCGYGVDPWRRPVHEHVPRDGQRHQQRRRDPRRGALGERARR